MVAAVYLLFGCMLLVRYLWVLFLAVMNLQESKDSGKLQGFALHAGRTVWIEGLLVDFLVQMTVANLIWMEFPQEMTVSGRVARLVERGSGWRQRRAIWWRTNLLAPFDRSGGHG